jgi:phage protein D
MYVRIDGTDASEEIADSIIYIEVDDSLSLPDMFVLHLRDKSIKWIDADLFAMGKTIEVMATDGGKEAKLISGEITAIEPRFTTLDGPTLVVRGYDLSHRSNRDKKSRSFVQMTISDIINKIANEAGLQAKVDKTPEVYDHLLQDNQTDWEFAVQLARRIGYRLFVEDRNLNFVQTPAASSQAPVIEWADDLSEFNGRMSTAGQYSEVVVQGWNPASQSQIVGRATTPQDMPQIGETRDGGQTVQQAFGIAAKNIIVNRPVSTQAEADALAQAICDERGRGFIEAECICSGNPAVQAGAVVELKGIGTRFSGTYRVTHAVHRYDTSGYKTQFSVGGCHATTLSELLAPAGGGSSSSHCPMLGVVTNNDDPDRLGRVKVKFPTLTNSHESHWARLVAPGAGGDRGLVWIPDVGDEVVVVFEHEDINRPIVIGGLWSQQSQPADSSNLVASGKAIAIHIDTHEGMGLKIMDSSNDTSLHLGDANNHLAISKTNRQASLKSAGGIEVEAADKIAASAREVGVDASTKAKIAGGAKVTLEAPAIELGENGIHPVVFGDQLLQYLGQLVALYQSHMHPGEMAGPVPVTPMPPVPPLPPPTPALISTKVKCG